MCRYYLARLWRLGCGIVYETHEDPDNAPSDGEYGALHEMEALLKRLQGFDALAKS